MNPTFFQDFPAHPDLYAIDRALHAELARRLPPELQKKAAPRFEAMGRATATELPLLVADAEANEPVHVPYDPWGRRVDEIRRGQLLAPRDHRRARHAFADRVQQVHARLAVELEQIGQVRADVAAPLLGVTADALLREQRGAAGHVLRIERVVGEHVLADRSGIGRVARFLLPVRTR